jgi:heme A synthase
MRSGLVVLGALVLLVGLVWIGQGLGYIKGSFMTGDMKWFWIGAGMVVAGVALGAFSLRRQSRA